MSVFLKGWVKKGEKSCALKVLDEKPLVYKHELNGTPNSLLKLRSISYILYRFVKVEELGIDSCSVKTYQAR